MNVPFSNVLDEWFASVSVMRTSADAHRPALVRSQSHVLWKALAGEPAAQLDLRDERALEPLRERDGVAHVIVVAVRDDEEIAALGLAFRVGAGRVAGQERVDVDARAGRPCPSGKRRDPAR